jgi:rhodanese-related sulfurtransferase
MHLDASHFLERIPHMFKIVVFALLATVAVAQQAPSAGVGTNGPTRQEPAYKAKKLTRAEFDALLTHPEQILLIDVRRPDEISSIGGFPVYLSIQIGDLKNHLNAIPKGRTIVTISNHASRAGLAADLLTVNGFNVAGAVGAQTYESDGGTLLRVAPPKPAANSKSN